MIVSKPNIYANMINEELQDMIKKNVVIENELLDYINEEGEIAIPLMTNALGGYIFTDYFEVWEDSDGETERELNGDSYALIEDTIDKGNILKSKMSKENLREILIDMFQNNDTSLYGILVISGKQRFNILHPVTAYLISIGEIILEDTLTVIFYPYKSALQIRENDYYIDQITKIMNTIIMDMAKAKGSATLSTHPSEVNAICFSDEPFNHNLEFATTGTVTPKNVLIPVQMMTSDITYPYYGFIHSYSDGSSYCSQNLCGMASGNLNIYDSYIDDYVSTCTGSEPNNQLRGLFTLSNMNCNSLYSEITTYANFKEWTYANQMYSIFTLYKDELKPKKKEEQKLGTDENVLSNIQEAGEDRPEDYLLSKL